MLHQHYFKLIPQGIPFLSIVTVTMLRDSQTPTMNFYFQLIAAACFSFYRFCFVFHFSLFVLFFLFCFCFYISPQSYIVLSNVTLTMLHKHQRTIKLHHIPNSLENCTTSKKEFGRLIWK